MAKVNSSKSVQSVSSKNIKGGKVRKFNKAPKVYWVLDSGDKVIFRTNRKRLAFAFQLGYQNDTTIVHVKAVLPV